MSDSLLPLAPVVSGPHVTVFHGDAIRVLRQLPPASVDSVVCDPPYAIMPIKDVRAPYRLGIGTPGAGCVICAIRGPLVGHSICEDCATEAEIDAFADAGMLGQQSQNWHEKATHSRGYADNDPRVFGRWCALWAHECLRVLKPGGHIVAFGGTRTWHRLASGVEDAGFDLRDSLAWLYGSGMPKSLDVPTAIRARSARTGHTPMGQDGLQDAMVTWAGWGTALKPAHEPIVLARKPLDQTVANTVTTHGTGALNVDGCRVEDGRWPSNVLLDPSQAAVLDQVSVERPSRFFWVAKPDRSERVTVNGVSHPTVKPLSLMRELVRLVTPAGGVCMDPFAGSGTTAEACLMEGIRSIAVERDESFIPLIQQRIDRRSDPVAAVQASRPDDLGLFALFDS